MARSANEGEEEATEIKAGGMAGSGSLPRHPWILGRSIVGRHRDAERACKNPHCVLLCPHLPLKADKGARVTRLTQENSIQLVLNPTRVHRSKGLKEAE